MATCSVDTIQAALDSMKASSPTILIHSAYNSARTCMDDLNAALHGMPNSINNLMNQKAELSTTLLDQKMKDVSVAKDRAILTATPEVSANYYDGFLPINRPLQSFTIPILIGMTLFLFSTGFFFLLALIGVNIRFDFDKPYMLATTTQPVRRFQR